MVKYYGIKEKLKKEEILYRYSKTRAKIYSILPGTKHEFWKRNYEYIYCKQMHLRNRDNSLPNGHKLDLHSIIVADLIRREDIKQLQKGLKDELFNHMTEQGFKGFQRGEYGSTAEHLTSLQYQIKQDKERLEKLQKRIQREQIKYEPARNVSKTYNEIDRMGQKTITGKMAISKEDYSELTALAKEGITSRAEISELEQSANYYRQKYFDCANALERMKTKYNELKEKCRPFLQALEHFPEVAKLFTEKVKQLFSFKEAQERAEKEAREKERQERIKARRNKRGMER